MGLSDSRYKDSFITQDQLDSLLEEARSTPLSPDDAHEPPDDPIITQDDIDALLNFGKSTGVQPERSEELVSQEDIDALLNPGGGKKDEPSADDSLISQEDIDALLSRAHDTSRDAGADDPVSQGDVDALLSGVSPSSPDGVDPLADFDLEDDGADLDLVTPEDIRKLLMPDTPPAGSSKDPWSDGGAEDLESISDDDIRTLISGLDAETEAFPSEDEPQVITQDDIDSLLAGVNKTGDQSTPSIDTDSLDDQISPNDIDRLLKGTGETRGGDGSDTEDNLISQDDIDKLLMGKYQEPEEETTLIDQEDIDRLLSSAKPFGDEQPAKNKEPEKLISQEDIDRLLQEDEREKDKTEDEYHDQVILEKLDKEKEKKTRPAKKPKDKKPIPKKRLFMALAAVCLLAVAGAVSFFLFKGNAGDSPSPQTDVTATHDPVRTNHETPPSPGSVTVTLNYFVAMAPPGTKGISYITLSLTFQIDDTPENPVKEYEPFFRNMIYEAMNKALSSQTEVPVAEGDLKTLIMDTLNGSLSQGSVSALEFTGYEAG